MVPLPSCRLYGAVTLRAPPPGPGRGLTVPCGWNHTGPPGAEDWPVPHDTRDVGPGARLFRGPWRGSGRGPGRPSGRGGCCDCARRAGCSPRPGRADPGRARTKSVSSRCLLAFNPFHCVCLRPFRPEMLGFVIGSLAPFYSHAIRITTVYT